MQVGLDPRAEPRPLRAADGLLDPDLHAPRDGFPLAICDGSYHTVQRTGASAAVSAKWLARPDSKVLAIVGAGHMAEGAIETCNEVFAWDEVRVWRRSQATLDGFAAKYADRFSFALRRRPISRRRRRRGRRRHDHARARADRPRRVDRPGTHIAAVGADKGGDQELDPRILQRARIFVDDIRQCRTDGEINVPLSEGLITEDDIAGEIGEVITGKKPGPDLGRRGDGLRLDRDRAAGLGHGAARVRARGRGRGRHREEDDLDVIAAIFEAKLSRDQAEQLVELMRRGSRVATGGGDLDGAMLDGEDAQLIAFWPDRESFDAYVASVPRPAASSSCARSAPSRPCASSRRSSGVGRRRARV